MGYSDWIAMFALILSGIGIYFARASAKCSETSAQASENSSMTAQEALNFEQKKYSEQKRDERKQFIDSLVKEAVEKWKTFGNAENIINRRPDLTEEEKKEIRQRSRRGVGKPV